MDIYEKKNKNSKIIEIPPVEMILAYLLEDEFENDLRYMKRVINHMYKEYEGYDVAQKSLIDIIGHHSREEINKILKNFE